MRTPAYAKSALMKLQEVLSCPTTRKRVTTPRSSASPRWRCSLTGSLAKPPAVPGRACPATPARRRCRGLCPVPRGPTHRQPPERRIAAAAPSWPARPARSPPRVNPSGANRPRRCPARGSAAPHPPQPCAGANRKAGFYAVFLPGMTVWLLQDAGRDEARKQDIRATQSCTRVVLPGKSIRRSIIVRSFGEKKSYRNLEAPKGTTKHTQLCNEEQARLK